MTVVSSTITGAITPYVFFAPNTSYESDHKHHHEGRELKQLVRELHENGIEVILDVVFNHTAEGNEMGPYFSFKGIDNNIYYMLTPDGKYYNFSGCGNVLNCNQPIVQQFILDCLRYWVTEYRIDGFRLILRQFWEETRTVLLWISLRFSRALRLIRFSAE